MTALHFLFLASSLMLFLALAAYAVGSDETPRSRQLLAEDLLSLNQASKLFPGDDAGGHLTSVTIWRWVSRGITLPDGSKLKLESIRVAGRILTSRQAVERFVERQNSGPSAHEAAPEKKVTAKPSKRSQAAAEKLKKLGA